MAADSTAPGHNKQYYPEEEDLLVSLKQLGLSWVEITHRYNQSVTTERHRTTTALENKWRQIRRTSVRRPNITLFKSNFKYRVIDFSFAVFRGLWRRGRFGIWVVRWCRWRGRSILRYLHGFCNTIKHWRYYLALFSPCYATCFLSSFYQYLNPGHPLLILRP